MVVWFIYLCHSLLGLLGFMSTENHFKTFKSAIARIYNKNNKVIGAGFLVNQYHLLTCAHVVTAALGIPTNTQESPDGTIELDFPLIAPGQQVAAKVVFWQPVNPGQRGEDIAGLQINQTLPMGVSPVQIVKTSEYWQHQFRIFGFPQGHDAGVWASGELKDIQSTGCLQMEAIKVPGYQVEPGFSGSPVWDESLSGVVGMAVAAEKKREGVKAAFLIPTNVLVEVWEFLQPSVQQFTPTPSFSKPNPRRKYYEGLLEQRKEELDAVLRQQGKALSDVDKVRLDRQAEELLQEIENLESKIN